MISKNFFSNVKQKVINLLEKSGRSTKVNFILTCQFKKENPATGSVDEIQQYFNPGVIKITKSLNLEEVFDEIPYLLE